MKPVILTLYACLAYRVYSGIVEFSGAASSEYLPSAMDSVAWNSGAPSGIKWAPGSEKMFNNWREGQEIRMRFDRRTRVLSHEPGSIQGRRMLPDRKMQQVSQSSEGFDTTTFVAPSQPGMSRTEYTEEEVRHIAKAVNDKTDGLTYQYSKDSDSFQELLKSKWDVSGCCGRIKVFDSVNPEQLIYETSCCHCRNPRGLQDWTPGEYVLAIATSNTLSMLFVCWAHGGSIREMLESISEKWKRRHTIPQIHPIDDPSNAPTQ